MRRREDRLLPFVPRAIAIVLAAAIVGGCGISSGDDSASAPRSTIAPIGRRTVVEGTVSRTVSGHVMVISHPPYETVVVVEDAVTGDLDGTTVRAEGRIREFDTAALERTLGIDLEPRAVGDFLGLPCVVATTVDVL